MKTSWRRWTTGAVSLMVACLAVIVPATSAHAAVLDVACTGKLTTLLLPGLLIVPQDITTDNDFDYSPCASLANPGLTAGHNHIVITGNFSCLGQVGSFNGTETITWNTGAHSTFTFTNTFATVGGQYVTTHTGAISEGQFTGDSAVETLTGPTLNLLQCLAPPGITKRTSAVTLTIFGS
jgi:hypothetical protein